MARFGAILLLVGQLWLAMAAGFHHHDPMDRHGDDCPVCEVVCQPLQDVPQLPVLVAPVPVVGELLPVPPLAAPSSRAVLLPPARGPPQA